MTQPEKHTPTPWKIVLVQSTQKYIRTNDGITICQILGGTDMDTAEQLANAAYIVKCCNNHPFALQLLETAMEQLTDENLKRGIRAFLETHKD